MQLSAAITSLSFIQNTTDPGENKENIQYISDWSGLSGFKQSGFKSLLQTWQKSSFKIGFLPSSTTVRLSCNN